MASTFRSFPEEATLEAALSLAEGVMNFAVTICDHPQAVHGRQWMLSPCEAVDMKWMGYGWDS